MFNQINLKEVVILAKVITSDTIDEEGKIIKALSMEECLEDMTLIDDLLTIMKSKSLMNKKVGLKRLLSGRIELSLCGSRITPGGSNIQLGEV